MKQYACMMSYTFANGHTGGVMKISFLASHGGSAARQIIRAMEDGRIPARTGLVITNNRDSVIYQWCLNHDIEVRHISSATHPDVDAEDSAILAALQAAGTGLVVLSGYMKRIGPKTLAAYAGRMLNIHPSLLPAHGGAGHYGDRVHAAVLAAGESISGATVHQVTERYDEGPILLQRQVPVLPDDTIDTLRARVQAVEGPLYVEAIQHYLADYG